MVDLEVREVLSRTLPRNIDYYRIGPDDRVAECDATHADVYIGEQDVGYFADADVIAHIRKSYGSVIGVMHDIQFTIATPEEHKTSKMLLGLVRGSKI